ncbi:KilA-N domain-containing protein [Comamonas kerstersii]|uniref:KilA-N domain-containing protein n=1 Tax=Comamonas kerstersii TaxID=225992 RepID=UPI00266C64D1|nr:KilA-N domain-containing protein [Comamonas kerstersii]
MSHSNSALQLGGITVRQLNGLFCLNDLHKASGRNKNHRPGEFLRNEQTKALIAEIETAEIPAVFSKEGRTGGTYACRELVIAYAAWINPAFHLKVLRAFLETSVPAQAAVAAAQTPTMLPSEKGCRSVFLNPSERELIEMLRWTTYAGRDAVRETARIMRMRCPWTDGDMANNTAHAKGVQVSVSMST